MDSKRLEILLNRYWSCVSSLEEEKELRDYFNNNEVDEDMVEIGTLFRYYQSEKKIEKLDGSFDSSVTEKIKKIKVSRKPKLRKLVYNYLKVAATVLIVITASYFYRQSLAPEKRPELLGTFEDPKEAYEETKKALMLIAQQMNKGRNQVGKLKMFTDAETKIKKPKKDTSK